MDPFDAVIRELRAAATQPVLPSLPQQKHRRGRKRIAISALATVVLFAGVSPVFTRRASSPTPDLTAPAWTAIMQRIDARRMAAFMHADPTRLLDADIRASAAHVSDLRIVSELHRRALVLGRNPIRVLSARPVSTSRNGSLESVHLLVVDEMRATELVDSSGAVIDGAPARGRRTWDVVVQRESGSRWRLLSVVERASPPRSAPTSDR